VEGVYSQRPVDPQVKLRKPMSKMFLPYNLARQLDKHFEDTSQGKLDDDSFYDLVETFQATGSEKNQARTAELFTKLPKEEVIRRAKIVARLDKMLTTIKLNRSFPASSG
jgi:hypothetical protein